MSRRKYFLPFLFLISLLFQFSLFSSPAFCSFYYHHSFNISNYSDDVEDFQFQAMRNVLFLGATLGAGGRLILGQNIIIWSKSHATTQGGQASDLSLMELGPRIMYYLNDSKEFGLSLAYHPYVKGTRTTAATATEEKIDGSSLYFSLSYLLKVSRSFYLGCAFNYHQISISESQVGTTETDVSQTYTTYWPSIELSIRF